MKREFSASLNRFLDVIILWSLPVTILISLPLWLGTDSFPQLGLGFPLFLDLILVASSLILFLSSPFHRFKKQAVYIAHFLVGLLLLSDLNRCQIYILYLLVINHIYLTSKFSPNVFLLLGLSYLWFGINKLNPNFNYSLFPWFISPLGLPFYSPWMGTAAALLEGLSGLLLLFPRLRKFGAMYLALMHTVILYLLSPLGHFYNLVVVPWNLILLVIHIRIIKDKKLVKINTQRSDFLLIVLVGIMPLLNFKGLWPDNLSFHAYSGSNTITSLNVSEEDVKKLPYFATEAMNSKNQINFYNWINLETAGGDFNSKWSNRKNFLNVCDKYELSNKTNLVLINRLGTKNQFFCPN